MSKPFNIVSENYGEWGFGIVDPLIQRTFPNVSITHDQTSKPDLVIRSHFYQPDNPQPYSCPYITWSGESFPVNPKPNEPSILDINTFYPPEGGEQSNNSDFSKSLYFPHLLTDCISMQRPSFIQPKKYCASYAFSVSVLERENLFRKLRELEPTCYSFGQSLHTSDNPFELPRNQRQQNAEKFGSFGFNVAMENKIVKGYLTEKIGYAFKAGSVPIYWGDTSIVNDFFNKDAFVNVLDYSSVEKCAENVVEIWRDSQKYEKFISAPLTISKTLEDYQCWQTEYRPWQKLFVDRLREAYPDL